MSRGEGEGMDQGTVSLKIRLATIQMKIIVYGDFRLGFFFHWLYRRILNPGIVTIRTPFPPLNR